METDIFRMCLFLVQFGDEIVEEYVLCKYSFVPKIDELDKPNMHFADTFNQYDQFFLN